MKEEFKKSSYANAVVFALGSEKASAYTSIKDVFQYFRGVIFRSEHEYANSSAAIDDIYSSGCDVVMLPNPYGNPARLEIYNRLRAVQFPVIVFDRGGLPNSWFFDRGFNSDSESYNVANWDKVLTNTQTRSIHEYVESLKSNPQPLESQGPRIGARQLRERLGLGEKKILFVPFQRPSDVTIKFFSKPIGSFDRFCTLVDEVHDYFTNTESDWTVLAKKHPLETTPPPTSAPLVPDDCNVYDLIEASDAVLLINSGVGLLASIWEKPVFIAGTAYYEDKRLNKTIRKKEDVFNLIEKLPCVDKSTRDKLLHHLVTNVYSFGEFDTEKVMQKDGAYRNITRNIRFDKLTLPAFTKKERILFVTPVIPLPVNRGSAVRTNQLLQQFQESGYIVDVLVLNQSEKVASNDEIIQRLRRKYPDIGFSIVKHPKLFSGFFDILRFANYQKNLFYEFCLGEESKLNSEFHCPQVFSRAIERRVTKFQYHAIFFNYLKVIPKGFAKNTCNVPIIADLHDVQFDRIVNDVAPSVSRFRRSRFLTRALSSEARLLDVVDKAICISDPDRIRLIELYGNPEKLYTIPATCTKEDVADNKTSTSLEFDLLFVGSNSAPNVDGLTWFLEKCWPRILLERPDTTLKIQGRVVKNKKIKQAIEKYENGRILVSEYIENIGQVYRNTKVVICPIRYGTGMKIKAIEAMAYGKPLVATKAALCGIEFSGLQEAGDTPSFFIEYCLLLLRNREALNKAAELSAECFETFHSQSALNSRFRNVLEKL